MVKIVSDNSQREFAVLNKKTVRLYEWIGETERRFGYGWIGASP